MWNAKAFKSLKGDSLHVIELLRGVNCTFMSSSMIKVSCSVVIPQSLLVLHSGFKMIDKLVLSFISVKENNT